MYPPPLGPGHAYTRSSSDSPSGSFFSSRRSVYLHNYFLWPFYKEITSESFFLPLSSGAWVIYGFIACGVNMLYKFRALN
jgi:hypothetical protein